MGVILEKSVGKLKNRFSKVLEQISWTPEWYYTLYNYKLSLGYVQGFLGYVQVSLGYVRVSIGYVQLSLGYPRLGTLTST